MILTDEHIKELRAIALPIDHGTIAIHIGAEARHLDIDVLKKVRIAKEPEAQKGVTQYSRTRIARKKKDLA